MTPKRAGGCVENDEYAAFARRVLRAYARRVADGDVEALTLMTDLPPRSTPPSARPSPACAPSATPGPRSAPGSASPARPPSNAGAAPRDRRDSRPESRTAHPARDLGRPPTTPHDHPWADFRAWERQLAATGTCSHPIRLRSRIDTIDLATGETRPVYDTAASTACCTSPAATAARPSARPARPSTSATPGSSSAPGLAGGKGIPETITAHPCVFATLTAPSFGPVHSRRMRGKTVLPCRPRRDAKRAPLPARPGHLLPDPPRRD